MAGGLANFSVLVFLFHSVIAWNLGSFQFLTINSVARNILVYIWLLQIYICIAVVHIPCGLLGYWTGRCSDLEEIAFFQDHCCQQTDVSFK